MAARAGCWHRSSKNPRQRKAGSTLDMAGPFTPAMMLLLALVAARRGTSPGHHGDIGTGLATAGIGVREYPLFDTNQLPAGEHDRGSRLRSGLLSAWTWRTSGASPPSVVATALECERPSRHLAAISRRRGGTCDAARRTAGECCERTRPAVERCDNAIVLSRAHGLAMWPKPA